MFNKESKTPYLLTKLSIQILPDGIERVSATIKSTYDNVNYVLQNDSNLNSSDFVNAVMTQIKPRYSKDCKGTIISFEDCENGTRYISDINGTKSLSNLDSRLQSVFYELTKNRELGVSKPLKSKPSKVQHNSLMQMHPHIDITRRVADNQSFVSDYQNNILSRFYKNDGTYNIGVNVKSDIHTDCYRITVSEQQLNHISLNSFECNRRTKQNTAPSDVVNELFTPRTPMEENRGIPSCFDNTIVRLTSEHQFPENQKCDCVIETQLKNLHNILWADNNAKNNKLYDTFGSGITNVMRTLASKLYVNTHPQKHREMPRAINNIQYDTSKNTEYSLE